MYRYDKAQNKLVEVDGSKSFDCSDNLTYKTVDGKTYEEDVDFFFGPCPCPRCHGDIIAYPLDTPPQPSEDELWKIVIATAVAPIMDIVDLLKSILTPIRK